MNDLVASENDLLPINYEGEQPTVSGRALHKALEVETPYRKWFPRMCEYGFSEEIDFNTDKNVRVQTEGNREVQREATDHLLTIPMAKEICMLQRSDKGKFFRRYFIKIEEAWNSPEMVMKRALDIANRRVENLLKENTKLIVSNETMRPKAEFFDELVDRNLLTSIRDTAKELQIKERVFVGWLIDHNYLFRDKKGKLTPKAGKSEGLFEVKETKNDKTGWAGQQTLVTPKGRETFRLLMEGLKA